MELDEDFETARRPDDDENDAVSLPDLDVATQGTKLYKNEPLQTSHDLAIERMPDAQYKAEAFSEHDMPPSAHIESFAALRVSCLYLFSKALGKINTKAVLAHANAFVAPSTLLGIEWINDESVVLVFTSVESCLAGFASLIIQPAELSTIQRALQSVQDMYSDQSADALRVLSAPQLARPLKDDHRQPTWIRMAQIKDKKLQGSRDQSKYYQERQQRMSRNDRERNSSGRERRPEKNISELDAELDAFVAGEELPLSQPITKVRRQEARDRELDRVDRRANGRRQDRDRQHDLQALDQELDNYTSGTATSEPIRRRRSPSPSVNAGAELFPASTSEQPSLLQRISASNGHFATTEPLQTAQISRTEEAQERSEANPLRDIFASISPVGYQPSLFAKRKRETAADLFDSAVSRPQGGLRGWDDD